MELVAISAKACVQEHLALIMDLWMVDGHYADCGINVEQHNEEWVEFRSEW